MEDCGFIKIQVEIQQTEPKSFTNATQPYFKGSRHLSHLLQQQLLVSIPYHHKTPAGRAISIKLANF